MTTSIGQPLVAETLARMDEGWSAFHRRVHALPSEAIEVHLAQGHLFFHLMEKPQAVCIHDGNRKANWQLVPADFQKLIGTNSFMAMSIFVGNQAYGLFYADRHTSACQIDNTSYAYFKKICGMVMQSIEHLQSNKTKTKTG